MHTILLRLAGYFVRKVGKMKQNNQRPRIILSADHFKSWGGFVVCPNLVTRKLVEILQVAVKIQTDVNNKIKFNFAGQLQRLRSHDQLLRNPVSHEKRQDLCLPTFLKSSQHIFGDTIRLIKSIWHSLVTR